MGQQSIYTIKIVTDGDMSSNVTSNVVDLSITNGYAIQAVWTGSPEGNLKLQISNDEATWTDVAESVVATGGTSGSTVWLEPTAMYDKVRVVYEATSGSGTLNIKMNGKGDQN